MAVVIQAGHVNIATNCNEGLRGETGAPGEVEYTAQIAAKVAGGLQALGPVAIVADANFNCTQDASHTDYQAVVALHCDGRDSSGFSCNVGNPTEDGAAEASSRLQSALRAAYAAETGLLDLSGDFVSDANISEYYLFEALTPKTPFVLLEMGAIARPDGSSGPDKDYLMSHMSNVASAIVDGIATFLGLKQAAEPEKPEAQPDPQPAPEPAPVSDKEAVLTNLGQAIAYGEQLEAVIPSPTLAAMLHELHVARQLLGGE